MKLLFVCTGNTCRSAMAEEIARVSMAEMGLKGEVSSAGTFASDGMPASVGAQMAVAHMGGDLSHHRASRLTLGRVEEADLVLCMESHHLRTVLSMLPTTQDKAYTLLSYADQSGDVEDPFGGDDATYIATMTQIGDAVRVALAKFRHEGIA